MASVAPTAQNYFTLFLQGLGMPVTQDNLNALYGVAQLEGWNNRYNPLNVVQQEPGSTAYNSVGVQQYADFDSGVKGAVSLFSNSHWTGVRAALQQGNNAQGVLNAFKAAYTWDPNVQFPMGQSSWGTKTIGSNAGSGDLSAVQTESAGESQLTGGGTAPGATGTNPTVANYEAIPGLQGLLTHIPELKALLNHAIATGQPVADFQDAVENSQWWKTNAATTRQYIALSLNDPAEYQKQLSDAEATVNTEAGQLGVHLNAYQTLSVAHAGLLGGNLTNKAWLDKLLAGTINPADAKNTNGLSGQLASTVAQLQQLGASYGQTSTPQGLEQAAQNILSGATTMDTYANHYKTTAKSMFPGLSSQIDSGMTVANLAQPYQQTMGQLLEIDPSSIKLSDPMIRKALQGTQGAAAGGTTTPTSQPLWQFENTVRSDPRWALTQNARDTASTALVKIGQDWGYM
jgi:hypothetical protein